MWIKEIKLDGVYQHGKDFIQAHIIDGLKNTVNGIPCDEISEIKLTKDVCMKLGFREKFDSMDDFENFKVDPNVLYAPKSIDRKKRSCGGYEFWSETINVLYSRLEFYGDVVFFTGNGGETYIKVETLSELLDLEYPYKLFINEKNLLI